MPRWNTGRVVRIEDAAAHTRRFWLDPGDPSLVNFKAGQFITLDLPIGEKRLDRWRSYSIASAPGESLLELCIVRLPGGRATDYLFEEVQVGSELRFKGPEGVFVMPAEHLSKTVVLVCTGTGIAPFRSMIRDVVRRGLTFHEIHLIFGTRYRDGLLYEDEWRALAAENPRFRYSIALSREEGALPASAVSGYVHSVYESAYGGYDADRVFYLCGWSAMIDEAVERLVNQGGYPRSQVIYELYG